MSRQESPLVNQRTLDILVQVAQQSGMPAIPSDRVRIMSHHNIVNNLLEVAKHFVNSDDQSLQDFCPFIVHFFMNKFERRSQAVHALYTHIYSWMKTLESSMECRLMASMLDGHRGSRAALRGYLRIRKEITKNNPMELLDEIFLLHEQTIAIVHRLYDTSKRGFICKWLNDFYVNINYRQTNNAKLQSCILVEFLLNCQGQMHSLEQEVRITSKDSRRENPGLFVSRIDKNNGFNIIKLKKDVAGKPFQTDRLMKSKITYDYSKLSPQKPDRSSSRVQQSSQLHRLRSSRSRSYQGKHLKEMQSNQLVRRSFEESKQSPQKVLRELSPSGLFKSAEKQLMHLTKIDQELDSRRNNPQGQPNRLTPSKQRPRDHSSEHSSYNLRDLSSSNLADKYNQDWEKMIERNQSFKEKMLRKSRGIVDRKRKLLEQSSLDMSSRDAHAEGKVYQRFGRPSQLHTNLDEADEQPLPTPFINTFKPDEINLERHLPPNFSFKDSIISVDENNNLPEIREIVGSRKDRYFKPS